MARNVQLWNTYATHNWNYRLHLEVFYPCCAVRLWLSMQKNEEAVRGVTAKAWRFTGEMEEIAAIFREAGLPGEFHAAAGAIYRRLAGFKDAPSTPSLERVLSALVQLPKDD